MSAASLRPISRAAVACSASGAAFFSGDFGVAGAEAAAVVFGVGTATAEAVPVCAVNEARTAMISARSEVAPWTRVVFGVVP